MICSNCLNECDAIVGMGANAISSCCNDKIIFPEDIKEENKKVNKMKELDYLLKEWEVMMQFHYNSTSKIRKEIVKLILD